MHITNIKTKKRAYSATIITPAPFHRHRHHMLKILLADSNYEVDCSSDENLELMLIRYD